MTLISWMVGKEEGAWTKLDLTSRRDRLLGSLVRQHSILPPSPATSRAKYATACIICQEGLHKVAREPKYKPPNSKVGSCAVPYVHVEGHVA